MADYEFRVIPCGFVEFAPNATDADRATVDRLRRDAERMLREWSRRMIEEPHG